MSEPIFFFKPTRSVHRRQQKNFQGAAMTDPKPTPTLMEDASLLHSAAMQYGDRWPIGWTADEAWARLRAALERLQYLENLQAYNPAKELDALRAEVAALTKKLEEVERRAEKEIRNADDAYMALRSGLLAERDTAESRATALAARVESLRESYTYYLKATVAILNHARKSGWDGMAPDELGWVLNAPKKAEEVLLLHSDDSRFLSAHNDRIRREALETLNLLARYIVTHHPEPIGDGACLECYPDNAFAINGFVCGWHTAKRLTAPHAGEKGEGG